jgi:hypothetical protein
MFKRLVFLSTLALAMNAGGLSAPSAVFAANPTDPDGILAGRPINGYSWNSGDAASQWQSALNGGCSCYVTGIGTGHGIAYAKVGGYIVLLYPWHGRADVSFDGKYVYGPNYSKIGYWMSDRCFNGDCASSHDLAVIVLYQGNWPATINHVYRGSQCCGDPPYWTITSDIGTLYSCANVASEWGNLMAQNYQQDVGTFWTYRLGTLTRFYSYTNSTHCTVQTDLVWHNPLVQPWPYRDSGTPWVDPVINDHTVSFINSGASYVSGDSNYRLWTTPRYDGMHLLYQYWQSLGSNAFLCKTATC